MLPVGAHGVKTGVAAELRRLAIDVNADPNTLRQYRLVAHGWPDGTRVPSASWAAHRAYMGPPQTAKARAKTIAALPRNEHGQITHAAVRQMTKGGGHATPNWAELLGRVSDTLTKARHQLDAFIVATLDRDVPADLRFKAADYATQAEEINDILTAIARNM
jgi:hypothetical protein